MLKGFSLNGPVIAVFSNSTLNVWWLLWGFPLCLFSCAVSLCYPAIGPFWPIGKLYCLIGQFLYLYSFVTSYIKVKYSNFMLQRTSCNLYLRLPFFWFLFWTKCNICHTGWVRGYFSCRSFWPVSAIQVYVDGISWDPWTKKNNIHPNFWLNCHGSYPCDVTESGSCLYFILYTILH